MKLHSQVASFTPANPNGLSLAYLLLLLLFIITIITRIEELDEVIAKRVSFRGNFGRDVYFQYGCKETEHYILDYKTRRKLTLQRL